MTPWPWIARCRPAPNAGKRTLTPTTKSTSVIPLADGDAVSVVKDLKVKGSSSVLKKGAKIKSIRLVNGVDGHNVDCKTDLGSMLLKSEFLKKA